MFEFDELNPVVDDAVTVEVATGRGLSLPRDDSLLFSFSLSRSLSDLDLCKAFPSDSFVKGTS